MKIIESKNYKKDYKKIILDKHLERERNRIENIKSLIIKSDNLQSLLLNGYSKVYYIEKKRGNLKEFYTARINSKIRLIMKPIGTYPYEKIEITEIEFVNIDDTHYGEG